ncbi:MAG: hypothetical protein KF703_20230, partial [Actinobacteria bacterium]|nr:hypothetical protein [Actinomycetota bacterium]
SNARRADQLHVRFLRRSATATEREIWAQRFTTEDDKLLAAALIASDEYYLWSQGRESINPPVTIGAATGS